MKEKAVIFECSADAIIDIRKRLDEIASVTNGSIWFETIGQNAINGNGPSLTKYSIICHYPESHMEIIDKYYESKVRNIQNTFKSELDFVRKENEELKKRLKSAEQSDYVTPLRDRVDICEEKIDEHEADLEDCKAEIDLLWNNAFTGLEKRVELFNNARKEDVQELFDGMEDCKKDISEQDRRLDCYRNRLMSLSERVNTLSKQYNEDIKELAWDKWKNDLPDNFCSNRIDTLCGEITAMDDRVASVEGEVEAIKESIGTDNLKEQLEKDFADVYEEFQNTKDQVNDINTGYIKWSSEVSQFDERIEKLEENMKELAANGGLGLSFNLMNERVSSNKRDISSLRNDIDDIHNWINAHDRMLKAQSSQMSDLGSELDEYIDDYKESYKHLNNADEALERRIKALEKKSDDCTKRMNLFSREIETYEEAYKQLRTSLDNNDTAIEKRIKAIEKRLNIKPFYEPTEDEKDDD